MTNFLTLFPTFFLCSCLIGFLSIHRKYQALTFLTAFAPIISPAEIDSSTLSWKTDLVYQFLQLSPIQSDYPESFHISQLEMRGI